MIGDPINLRQARKRRMRADAAESAAANRRQFGRTKAEKAETALERERRERDLEGHRRSTDVPHEPEPDA